jgi:Histidine kinase
MMHKEKLNDSWFRFVGMPVIAFMAHFIFFNSHDTGHRDTLSIFFLSLIETLVLWEANRLVILYFRRKYPALEQTGKRMGMITLFCIIVTVVLRSLNIFIYDVIKVRTGNIELAVYLKNIFIALLFVFIVGGVYEAIYYFRKWKVSAVEAEALKKENLQTQLDSLKVQINPHFLFNSLGSLSSLIDEDKGKAQEFLGQMSAVYRYLLQANEKQLTTLQNEMEFITAYSNMLTTRFAEGLHLSVAIDKQCMDHMLPPLTVQILLENAVKHNAATVAKPLQVKIFTDDAQNLAVENNLQKKSSPVASNKTGLNNIVSKYKLLNQPDIVIEEGANYFKVIVPLIKNKDYAGINS